jgi:hypothetical protein
MVIDTPILLRLAGASAAFAIVALLGAAITIALFFGGAGEIYGPINDILTAVTALALVLPILAVDRVADGAGLWLRAVAIAAVIGCIVIAATQISLVVGWIDLTTSFVLGGVGFVPVAVWCVAVAIVALPMGVLPSAIGWLVVVAILLIVAGSVLAAVANGPAVWLSWAAVTAVLVAWLGAMSAAFLSTPSAG